MPKIDGGQNDDGDSQAHCDTALFSAKHDRRADGNDGAEKHRFCGEPFHKFRRETLSSISIEITHWKKSPSSEHLSGDESDIQARGVKSLRQVALALNARGIATARGGTWTAVQVTDIINRDGRLKSTPSEPAAAAPQDETAEGAEPGSRTPLGSRW